ncbi:MAG: hypothetical protein V8Q27_00365 [Eubacteriales bacterium]
MDNYYGIILTRTTALYNDVLDWWHTEEEESQPRYLLKTTITPTSPRAFRATGTYQMVVQILDGVKSFMVDYYPGDVSGERISFEMTIE